MKFLEVIVAFAVIVSVFNADCYRLSNLKITPRIFDGSDEEPNSLPYQVLLLVDGSDGLGLCGGSLISPDYVLTAAHCLDGGYDASVIFGAHNFIRNETSQLTVHVSARSFIIHSGYDPRYYFHDIALIRLPQSIIYTKEISPINLPTRSDTYTAYDNLNVTASGWGLTGDDTMYSTVLQYANFKIMPYKKCREFYEYILLTSFVCIDTSSGPNICEGDSGGPLVLTDAQGKKTLIGVAAFGYESCEAKKPSAFTRTASYLDWITKHTGIPILP